MQGMDTNVIVRYLTGGDPQQADQACAVIGQKPGFVPRTVLLVAALTRPCTPNNGS